MKRYVGGTNSLKIRIKPYFKLLNDIE
jgi:hypothetical protein